MGSLRCPGERLGMVLRLVSRSALRRIEPLRSPPWAAVSISAWWLLSKRAFGVPIRRQKRARARRFVGQRRVPARPVRPRAVFEARSLGIGHFPSRIGHGRRSVADPAATLPAQPHPSAAHDAHRPGRLLPLSCRSTAIDGRPHRQSMTASGCMVTIPCRVRAVPSTSVTAAARHGRSQGEPPLMGIGCEAPSPAIREPASARCEGGSAASSPTNTNSA